MRSKTTCLLLCVFLLFCVLGYALISAFVPCFLGKTYTLKIENPHIKKLPFGYYLSIPPTEHPNANDLLCKEVFAQLSKESGGYVLSERISCTPPSTPYIKGIKTPYGISFQIKDTYIPPQKAQKIKNPAKLMAKMCVYKGEAYIEEIIF